MHPTPHLWTEERIRDERPNIWVRMPSGKVVEAHPVGPVNQFVSLEAHCLEWSVDIVIGEWSTSTVIDCMNSSRMLVR